MEKEIDFGDYVKIEQKRHGVPNEMYLYKVIGRMHSNTWVEVPVQSPETEAHHNVMSAVLACICCGVYEVDVRKFRVEDVAYARQD